MWFKTFEIPNRKKFLFFQPLNVCYEFSISYVFFRPDCRARKYLSRIVWVVPSKMLTDFEINAKKHPRPHWGMCYQALGMFLLQAREVAGQSNLQEANSN